MPTGVEDGQGNAKPSSNKKKQKEMHSGLKRRLEKSDIAVAG